MNIKLRAILFTIVVFCVHGLFAQSGQNKRGRVASEVEKSGDKKDSIVFKMKSYRLVDGMSRSEVVKVDTSINNFQVINPALKHSITVESLGNLGSSYQSNDFFNRHEDGNNFIFLKNYDDYAIWPNRVRFYNVTKPYTLLEYGQLFSNRPKGETLLNIIHTQNINKNLNFGLYYNSIASTGKYLNQEAKVRSLGFYTSYNIDRYDLWLSLGKNKFEIQENGGLPVPASIENPDLKPENLPVWLDGSGNELNNFSIALSHQYKLGIWKEMQEKDEIFQKFIPRVALMHTMEIANAKREYHEVEPNPYFNLSDNQGVVYFYGDNHVPYINNVTGTTDNPATLDLSSMNLFSNRFYLKFVEAPDRKYTFGKSAFIGNDIVKLTFPREFPDSTESVLGLTQKDDYYNTFIGGSFYRTEGKFWNWKVDGKYYIMGRNFADFELKGNIDKPIIIAKDTSFFKVYVQMANRTPDYFLEHYYSNHYKWENSFKKIYNLNIGAIYDLPRRKFNVGANYSITNNYVLFNEQVLPEQASSEFSVIQLFLRKDFKFGGMNFQNTGMFQQTSTKRYVQLPQLVFKNSSFYEGVLSKVLFYQLGIDFRYESKYYADYYSPATGMFYLQQNEKIGNYPWIDAFVNLRIKRTRFYVKYTNMATLFMDGGYWTSPNYPAQVAAASFGLSWSFYD